MKQFLLIICAALLAAANLQAGGPVFGGGATVDTNALASGILTTAASNVAAGTNAQAAGIITTAKAYTDAATNHGWRIYVPRTVVSSNCFWLNFPLSTNAWAYRFRFSKVASTASGVGGCDFMVFQVNGVATNYAFKQLYSAASGALVAGSTNSIYGYAAPALAYADVGKTPCEGGSIFTLWNPSETNPLSRYRFHWDSDGDNFWNGATGTGIDYESWRVSAPTDPGGCTNILFFPRTAGAAFVTNLTYWIEYLVP